jgi:hypothetical protein
MARVPDDELADDELDDESDVCLSDIGNLSETKKPAPGMGAGERQVSRVEGGFIESPHARQDAPAP